MGAGTKIEWCDFTFNHVIGCSKVHTGCANCYAEADMDKRRGRVKWGPQGTRSRTSDQYWKQPFKWNREAEKAGERRRVFCASLADVFEDWNGPILDSKNRPLTRCNTHHCTANMCPPEIYWPEGVTCPYCLNQGEPLTMGHLRSDLFALIDATPNLDWLLLTKRPENVRRMWPEEPDGHFGALAEAIFGKKGKLVKRRDNVWLLTSISNQETADKQVPELLKCRDLVPVLGLSCEPLLGPVDLQKVCKNFCPQCRGAGEVCNSEEGGLWIGCPCESLVGLNWVIIGGESGKDARPCDLAWIRSLVQQCQAAGVAAFVKQVGSNPYENGQALCTHAHDPKGGDISEFPADLRVRQFPK